MALLGSLRCYRPDLPGFWDYPSGTIGDALLVPTLVAALVAQALALPSTGLRAERRIALAAGALGFIGGAAVPLSWVANASTKPLWLLPRSHHYLLAGWWHAAYLSLTTAAIAGLTVTVFRRLHATRRRSGIPTAGLQAAAMTFAVGSGMAMLILIGRDSVAGGATAASATTAVALVVVTAAFLSGLAWACGREVFRTHWRSGAIIVATLIGVLALIARWQPDEPLIVGISAVISLLGALAATSPFVHHDRLAGYRYPTAVAVTAMLTGGLVRAADALFRGERWPFAWILAAILLTIVLVRIVGPRQTPLRRVIGFGLFLGYCVLMCYLAERIKLPHSSASSAGASVSVADAAFDVLVISLVQSRFGELGEADQRDIEMEYVSESEHRDFPTGYLEEPAEVALTSSSPEEITEDVALLGLAVGLGLLMLLAVAAGPLGLDRRTSNPASIRLLLVPGVALCTGIFWIAKARLGTWRTGTPEPVVGMALRELQLPTWYWIAPLGSAVVWAGVIIALSGGRAHIPVMATSAALIVLVLYAKSLVWGATRLQTLTTTSGQWIISIAAGLSIATATFWIIAFGIWEHDQPLSGGSLSATALAVFLGNAVVFAAAGNALGSGISHGRESQHFLCRRNTMGYFKLDGAVFGVVAAIGLGIPVYAAVRDSELHVSSLNVVASLVFMPGFVSAVVWGLHNWRVYDQLVQHARIDYGLPKVLLARADGDWRQADACDIERRGRLHRHLESQRDGLILLMALGLVYLTTTLLR
jgi:hypothetical protein